MSLRTTIYLGPDRHKYPTVPTRPRVSLAPLAGPEGAYGRRAPHLVQREADGHVVDAVALQLAHVLLHEGDDDGAVVVVVLLVGVLELDGVLRVAPERV